MDRVWIAIWNPKTKTYISHRLKPHEYLTEERMIRFTKTKLALSPTSKVFLYCLNNALDSTKRSLKGLNTIPKQQEELPAISTRITRENVDELVANVAQTRDVTIIAWVSSVTDEFLQNARKPENLRLFEALTLDVTTYAKWTREDVLKNMNGGKIRKSDEIPAEDTHKIEGYLAGARYYTSAQEKDETAVRYVAELKSQIKRPGETFASYFEKKSPTDRERHVRTPREFEFVAAVRTASEGAKHDREFLRGTRSSSLITTAITAIYTQPVFRSLAEDDGPRRYSYRQETPWRLNLFLRSKGREGTEYAKYSPSSDLHLDNSYGIPLLIGEIVSEPSEEDRERMLLQAVGLVRVARCFCKNPAIMAVYFDNEYLAARYIAYTDKMDEKKIQMSEKEFDLTDQCQGRKFIQQTLNFGDYIRGPGTEFDADTKNRLDNFLIHGKNLPTLTSKSKSSQRSHSASNSVSQQHSTLDSIEEDEE